MELVPGKSLDKLIPKGGMPLGETLRLAIPIADALARAHGAGIVHRDLKPANVVVGDGAVPKVLDFGLAKLLAREDVAAEDTLSEDTAASPLSHTGAISGTPSYMSPEQATGQKLDARSDIFSFGSVLYEMVTGRRASAGGSRRDTLSAVASAHPRPPGEIAPGVPADLEKLILRCLRKDPDRRFQHMSDVRVALEDVREESASGRAGALPRTTTGPGDSRTRLLASAALLLVLAGVALLWRQRSPASAGGPRPMTRLTWDGGLSTDAAPSPSGSLLAYASDRSGEGHLDIWLQPLPQGEPIRLTRHGSDDYEPSFSPDGSRIAFRSDRDGGGVYVISALGGQETRIAPEGRRPRFSPDGRFIAYWVGDITWVASEVYVVASTGGQPRQLGTSRLALRHPLWSPDGTHVLCMGFPTQVRKAYWIALPVDGGDPIVTDAGEVLAKAHFRTRSPDAWAPDGERVIFFGPSGDSTNLWSLRVSPKTWRVEGPPEQLTFGTGDLSHPARAGDRLFFTSSVSNVDLWALPLDAATGKVAGSLRRLTDHAGRDDWPSISEDGSRIAYLSERAGAPGVWLKDLRHDLEIAITRPPVSARYPRLSADGSRVAYLASAVPDDGTRLVEPAQAAAPATGGARTATPQRETSIPVAQRGNLFVTTIGAAGAIGAAQEVCHECGRPWDWSRDGRYLLYRAPAALMLLEVAAGTRTEIASHPSLAFIDSRFSPDDRWIAFTSPTGTFTRRTFLMPFRGAARIPESDWILVVDGERLERQVSWSPDGALLYFHSERDGYRCLWAQGLDPATKRPLGEPFPVHHFHRARGSMTTAIGDPGAISPSVGRDLVVFSLGETAGNVWSTPY